MALTKLREPSVLSALLAANVPAQLDARTADYSVTDGRAEDWTPLMMLCDKAGQSFWQPGTTFYDRASYARCVLLLLDAGASLHLSTSNGDRAIDGFDSDLLCRIGRRSSSSSG